MAADVRPSARAVTAFVFVTVFLDLVGFGIVIPLFPLYVKAMGGSAETVGLILSTFSFTQLVATPFLGRLSDRLGRRPVILLSLAGNAASMVLFALATKVSLLWLLFASRILAGATAGNLAACQAAIADVTAPEQRAKGMGLVGAGIGLGMVLGPVIGGWASRYAAWAPPALAAAMAFADLIGVLALMPETNLARHAVERRRGATLAQAMRQRSIVLVLAVSFSTFLAMSNLQVALPLMTAARLRWDEVKVGDAFGGFGLVMLVVQAFFIERMARAWGARRLVVAGSIASAIGLVVLAAAFAEAPAFAGLALLALGVGVVNPCLSTIASEEAGPQRQGAVLGFTQSAGGLARTVGPYVSGVLYARVTPGAPFVGGAIAATLAAAFGVALVTERRAPRVDEA